MLNDDIIEPSNSPYNFPLLLVPKKDGTIRLVIDYRKLNLMTIADRYPAHNMEDVLNAIGSRGVFSNLDMLNGFLQVALTEESKEMTAFSTPKGHYQYRRMPFGLRSSPLTFQRLINIVLKGLVGKYVYVYMDDILVCIDTVEQHLRYLEKFLID